MNRTKILSLILFILVMMLCTLMYIKKYYQKINIGEEILNILDEKKIIIPSTSENKLDYDFITFKQTDNFEPHNINDIKNIFYTILNNRWNNFTFYCPTDYENCVDDITSYANDKNTLSLLNNYVNPYNSYKVLHTSIEGNDTIILNIDYLYTDEEINYLKSYISNIINTLQINKNNITVSNIKSIHNYLINNLSYDDKFDINTSTIQSNKAYGAIINNKAVCSGYADSFALFLNELNIPNFRVASEEHIWNVIYFNNTWSHIDVTWDDDEKYESNIYNFFMVNTSKLLEKDKTKHTFDNNSYLELQ